MRTLENVSVSEFAFSMEVLDEDFDFEDDSVMAEISNDSEFNHNMEDLYG